MPFKHHKHLCIHCAKSVRCRRGEKKTDLFENIEDSCWTLKIGVCNSCFKRLEKEMVEKDQKLIRENPHRALVTLPHRLHS